MTFHASIITLYPQMFPGPLGMSIAGRALEKGVWSLETTDIRKFGLGKHRQVDDTPAGGGPGMVLRADVMAAALDHASTENDARPKLVMSPRGTPFDQAMARKLSTQSGVVILCGRFEGIDQRLIDSRNLVEVSLGDFVLSGGEIAATAMLDSIIRLLPGVMGNAQSGEQESHESNLLEHPQYTRPQIFEGLEIPEILTSGNHQHVKEWQLQQSQNLTRDRRPDLWERYEKKK